MNQRPEAESEIEAVPKCDHFVQRRLDVDFDSGDGYRRAVMNTFTPATAAASSLDACVENVGGLYALSVSYLGYAYFYFYPSPTGGL